MFIQKFFIIFLAIFSVVQPSARHYAVLGLKPHATREEVGSAYRKLIIKHHPDKGGNSERCIEIQNAYQKIKKTLDYEREEEFRKEAAEAQAAQERAEKYRAWQQAEAERQRAWEESYKKQQEEAELEEELRKIEEKLRVAQEQKKKKEEEAAGEQEMNHYLHEGKEIADDYRKKEKSSSCNLYINGYVSLGISVFWSACYLGTLHQKWKFETVNGTTHLSWIDYAKNELKRISPLNEMFFLKFFSLSSLAVTLFLFSRGGTLIRTKP